MGLFDMFKREEEIPKADRLVIDDEPEIEDHDDTIEEEPVAKSAPDDREDNGPFDVSEAPEGVSVVDLGSLRIPAKPGLALRLEMEERSQQLVAIALDYEGSTLQVQAFAAPRSSGVWADVREKLAEQVVSQKGEATELDSPVGPSLHTRVPTVKDGPRDRVVEFYGVDGPRWFLRGVLTGAGAGDDTRRAEMLDLFRSIVVVRGDKPVPPRDLLPLSVPSAMAEQMAAARGAEPKAV